MAANNRHTTDFLHFLFNGPRLLGNILCWTNLNTQISFEYLEVKSKLEVRS